MCYHNFMMKDELRTLFNIDLNSVKSNNIDNNLFNNFGNILLSLADSNSLSQEVLNVYKKFVAMKPEALESKKKELFITIRNFAKEQSNNHKYLDALVLYRFLAVKSELLPDDFAEIAQNLASLGAKELAIKFMAIYEQREQNKPLMFITLANFYNLQLKEYKTAISYYEKYLQIDKTKSVIYTIVGNLYKKVYGDSSLEEQIFYYEKANSLKPNDRLITHMLAFSYEKLGNKLKAKQFYKTLLTLNPTEIDYYNYGAFLISCGDLKQGHKYFSHRFSINDVNLEYPVSLHPEKRWNLVSDISDKILLVHYEQGFGDTFMYCRFIPELAGLAKKVIFVVQDSLFDLIKNSPIIAENADIVSDKEDLNNLTYDLHMALLDTPYVLKTEPDSIPYKDGYLSVSLSKITDYSAKYLKSGNDLRVGISYCGDKAANYYGRDIAPEKFNVLTDIQGVTFYSFSLDNNIKNSKITELGSSFHNFTDTASALKNMDLVISTDNVILNLAGALGVNTVGLFNKQTNYRWFKLAGENVGWYNSVKPLQVDSQDNWNYVFSQLVNLIADYSKK